MDKLVTRNPLHFNLLNTSPDFSFEVSNTVSQYRMLLDLTEVRKEVNNLEGSVVVQGLELAINLALYGLLWSLGSQYIVGNCKINVDYK